MTLFILTRFQLKSEVATIRLLCLPYDLAVTETYIQ